MKKLLSGILSAILIISVLSMSAYAENAAMLLPNDMLYGVLTKIDSSDLYYVDFDPPMNVDYDISIETDTECDVFANLLKDGEVLYSGSNIYDDDIQIYAVDIVPGRYNVEVFGDIPEGVTVDYTIRCSSQASNPGVFEGTNIDLNTYEVSHSRLSYWQFTLEKDSDVTIRLNGPTNKKLAAVVYNEYDVYDSVSNGESSVLNLHLKAGTYYIETEVNSIGEDSVQVGVFVQK